jgi:hypothetical protein
MRPGDEKPIRRSESLDSKLGARFIRNGPIDRINLVLDVRNLISVEYFDGSHLETLDNGTAAVDQLVA